jgi:hypothetical protein
MPNALRLIQRLRRVFSRRVAPHRHSALLVAIVTALLVRSLVGDSQLASVAYSMALLLVLLVALYNINVDELVGGRGRLLTQSRQRLRLGWVLAAAAALERFFLFFLR